VNSLISKLSCLGSLAKPHNVALFSVTETWLTEEVPDSFVSLEGYLLIRGDTGSKARKHGTCIFVKKHIKSIEVPTNIPNTCAVHLVDLELFVLSVYRPPSNDDTENLTLLFLLEEFCINREVLLLGDFNLPGIPWSSDTAASMGYLHPTVKSFYDCLLQCGLTQWVREPTFRSGITLDLIFTSEDNRIGDLTILAPFPQCLHSPVMAYREIFIARGPWVNHLV